MNRLKVITRLSPALRTSGERTDLESVTLTATLTMLGLAVKFERARRKEQTQVTSFNRGGSAS